MFKSEGAGQRSARRGTAPLLRPVTLAAQLRRETGELVHPTARALPVVGQPPTSDPCNPVVAESPRPAIPAGEITPRRPAHHVLCPTGTLLRPTLSVTLTSGIALPWPDEIGGRHTSSIPNGATLQP